MGLLEKDKRKFTVIIGSKKCGVCCGTGPSLAARKVKGKSGAFYLKEMTKGSKKKLYGPYSSKKNVVQRGGTLLERICDNVLNILEQCNKEEKFTEEMKRINVEYGILENTYKCLGINEKRNKCFVLSGILQLRSAYVVAHYSGDRLLDCLCSISHNYNLEKMFIHQRKFELFQILYYETMAEYYTKFYSNWEKLIDFLRITIRQIELEIREKNRKNRKILQNELRRNKPNSNLNGLKAQLEEARRLFAQGGPKEEENSNNVAIKVLRNMMSNQKERNGGPAKETLLLTNEELLSEMFKNNIVPTKRNNNQNEGNGGPAKEGIDTSNLMARLAKLKEEYNK